MGNKRPFTWPFDNVVKSCQLAKVLAENSPGACCMFSDFLLLLLWVIVWNYFWKYVDISED